ncbi:Fatty acid amide hydrolase [Porphyridium purpureum]|uniref:Fatty acid amide hydrolase n=1 Tax=Porphyridium purpureum TaxID=35688 RepID=A0A5J4YIC2_PORPP|nr:Fatty acid amide hydrolase [Porphyridium purpureum]|eukprot:POR8504..scf251_18
MDADDMQDQYSLKTLQAPVLSGWQLRWFVRLVETFELPLRFVVRRSGFNRLLELQRDSDLVQIPVHDVLAAQQGNMTDQQRADFVKEMDAVFSELFEMDSARSRTSRSVWDYVQMYRAASSTPLQVVADLLDLVKAQDPRPFDYVEHKHGATPCSTALNCFSQIDEEQALDAARQSTERWQSGHPISLLDGVPVAIKECFKVRNYRTTCGLGSVRNSSRSLEQDDAPLVAVLRDLGCVVVGLTTMDENGLGVRGFNASWGQVRNSVNPQFVSGGSSAGSGACVGAGMCPIAVGVDGGGSIRIPAGFNGIVGVKPTYGRVNGTGCFPPGAKATSHSGPMASCVLDAALEFYAMLLAGPDPGLPDPHPQLPRPKELLDLVKTGSIKSLKLGVFWPWFNDCAPQIRDACAAFVEKMQQDGGATVIPITIPNLEDMRVAHSCQIITEHASSLVDHGLESLRDEMGLDFRAKLQAAMYLRQNPQFVRGSYAIRADAMALFRKLFEDEHLDAIVTPTTAILPPRVPSNVVTGELNGQLDSLIMRYAFVGNFVGLPAGTVNIGLGPAPDCLPIGMQFMCAPWAEAKLLHLMFWCEQRAPQRARAEAP